MMRIDEDKLVELTKLSPSDQPHKSVRTQYWMERNYEPDKSSPQKMRKHVNYRINDRKF